MEEDISIRILGITSKETIKLLNQNFFDKDVSDHEIILFVGYCAFDVPVGYQFEKIENNDGSLIMHTPIILKKVTQQFSLIFDEIPHGFKTICRFEFTEGKIPDSILKLPVIQDWYDSKTYLKFC
jgi:hypothetical protein